jgi:tRNA-2-methylthio-N6-dimethylallyladenosine synthase
MFRGYTREQYLEKIAMLRAAPRNLALSTDIIVGFPGETEADFAETLSLLEAVEFDSIFSYTYSPRPNTPARAYEDAIPDEEKRRRLEAVHETQRVIQSRKNRGLVGSVSEVIVEGRNAKLNQWIGRTPENRVLNFTVGESAPDRNRLGTYAWVRVTGAFANSLVGEMIPASHGEEAVRLAVPAKLAWSDLPVLHS